jgi:Domain of unknown function (DUF397)
MPTFESRPDWVRSSLSFTNGNCVEVAPLSGEEVRVHNSRHAAGAVLHFTPDEWHAFLGGVKNGEFDTFGTSRPATYVIDTQSFEAGGRLWETASLPKIR